MSNSFSFSSSTSSSGMLSSSSIRTPRPSVLSLGRAEALDLLVLMIDSMSTVLLIRFWSSCTSCFTWLLTPFMKASRGSSSSSSSSFFSSTFISTSFFSSSFAGAAGFAASSSSSDSLK
eukprot:CAMPEP_0177726116 /NCGR_PEP_ID=MMETSP0484_2-20121128/19607_1 /TAXON_ID=354590 /ORGANISM="Rhodomonas lens, Strain RHODO" /LENGTH=118 /DNA_ID=CAMNT_0019238663 /DNA_START=500 /DNA_END=856 /DNA_ORIENTATION=-